MRAVSGVVAIAVLLAGCATASKDIATSYVSPIQFNGYDCDQIGAEAIRLQGRAQQLGARLDQAADNDKAIMAVSLVLFWPAAFALGGTKAQEAEYAQVKGQMEALQQAAIAKKCPGSTLSPAAKVAPQ